MPSIHDRSARRDAEHLFDDDLVELEPVVGGPVRPGWTGQGEDTATWRSRLAVVAGFLAVFHLAFALIKATGPAAGSGFTSDAPAWSLLLRATVAGLVFALLRSSLPLGRRQLRIVEWGLLGVEMLFILATQYLSVIDLIDRRDLIDAVAIQGRWCKAAASRSNPAGSSRAGRTNTSVVVNTLLNGIGALHRRNLLHLMVGSGSP